MTDHRIQTMALEDTPAFTGMPWPAAEGDALKGEEMSSRQLVGEEGGKGGGQGGEGGEEQEKGGEEQGMYSLGEPKALAYIIGERRPSGPEGDRGTFEGFDKKGHEVEMLLEIYENKLDALMNLFGVQFVSLETEAQVIMGLCGLAITVTGFSGGNVIRSGSVSSGFLVGGMFFILVSAYIALYTFSKMHYVSEMIVPDRRVWLRAAITERNSVRSSLSYSAVALSIGLICYISAVSIAAVTEGSQLVD